MHQNIPPDKKCLIAQIKTIGRSVLANKDWRSAHHRVDSRCGRNDETNIPGNQ